MLGPSYSSTSTNTVCTPVLIALLLMYMLSRFILKVLSRFGAKYYLATLVVAFVEAAGVILRFFHPGTRLTTVKPLHRLYDGRYNHQLAYYCRYATTHAYRTHCYFHTAAPLRLDSHLASAFALAIGGLRNANG